MLLDAGSPPRRVVRYVLAAGQPIRVQSEIAAYQPIFRFDLGYTIAETHGSTWIAQATVVPRSASMLLSILQGFVSLAAKDMPTANPIAGMLSALSAPCAARVALDSRGVLMDSELASTCPLLDANTHGLRSTPLRPGVPWPEEAVGIGARWQTETETRQSGAPLRYRETYTLLDASAGAYTVAGELERRSQPLAGNPGAAPAQAWLLARVVLSELVTAATVAWVTTPPARLTEENPAPISVMRLNTVLVGPSRDDSRDQLLGALQRALATGSPELVETAVHAGAAGGDWRFLAILLEVERSRGLQHAVDDALSRLTGRVRRGPEDWSEASAPYACAGDHGRAEALLGRGIGVAGQHSEGLARLLVLRAQARRSLGRMGLANDDYRRALELGSTDESVARAVAWWLATAPEPSYREPGLALTLVRGRPEADQVLALGGQAEAAALAELGEFAEAIRVQKAAAERVGGGILPGPGADERRAAARLRLEAYSQQRPWREDLTLDEQPLCCRYRGLSATLL